MKTFFVTGTDTDVGKTYVSCALLAALKLAGYTTLAMKPVAAGCEKNAQGFWQNDDALALSTAITADIAYEALNPYALRSAIAPHIAAKQDGVDITLDDIVNRTSVLQQREEQVFLIEGAGGWRVPLNDQHMLSALPRCLNIPVILVVDMRLGCLNHSLLTVEAIKQDGVCLAAWVANNTQDVPMAAYRENLRTLKKNIAAPCIAELPFASCVDINAGINLSIFS